MAAVASSQDWVLVKMSLRGQREISAGKGPCYQAWQPETNPPDPHGGRKETMTKSCPLTSCHVQCSKHMPTYISINNFLNAVKYSQLIFKPKLSSSLRGVSVVFALLLHLFEMIYWTRSGCLAWAFVPCSSLARVPDDSNWATWALLSLYLAQPLWDIWYFLKFLPKF